MGCSLGESASILSAPDPPDGSLVGLNSSLPGFTGRPGRTRPCLTARASQYSRSFLSLVTARYVPTGKKVLDFLQAIEFAALSARSTEGVGLETKCIPRRHAQARFALRPPRIILFSFYFSYLSPGATRGVCRQGRHLLERETGRTRPWRPRRRRKGDRRRRAGGDAGRTRARPIRPARHPRAMG